MAFAWTHSAERPQTIPQVTDRTRKPEGVVSKRAQQYVIVGIAIVIVLVAMFSSNRQRRPISAVQAGFAPPIHEGNQKKVTDYGQELAAEQQRALTQLPPPSNPTVTVQPNGPAVMHDRAGTATEWTRVDEHDPLMEKERERAYNARFSSNIAYAERLPSVTQDPESAETTPIRNTASAAPASNSKKPANVNVNSATGQPYVLFEGTILETALVTRLDGDFSGPVKVLITNPVYSRDRQHVLIPEGTNVLGEVRQVQGFGQRRLAVVFHRLIMPDGYTVDLDQFHGLNQLGETGLKDQVNNHYVQIFGASIALGLIAGAAESSTPTVGINETGSEAYRVGVASSLSQSSTRVLDRFLNIPPTLTIHEGYRVKIYMTNDLLLPAYENHTIPPNI